MNSIYTNVERAFLCDYFGVDRPKFLLDVDVYDSSDFRSVSLRDDSNYDGVNLANGVARLALSRLEVLGRGWTDSNSHLKDVTISHPSDGDDSTHHFRKIDLYPLYLFGVNWSIPTDYDDFPEYYYLTWFPEFDRYVITASVSNKDTYGVADFAIGWNNASNKRIDICHDVISTYWLDVHKPFNGIGWRDVLSTGLVPEQLANDWKGEVWDLEHPLYAPLPTALTGLNDRPVS